MTTNWDNLENFFDDLDSFWWFEWFQEENKEKKKENKNEKIEKKEENSEESWFFDNFEDDETETIENELWNSSDDDSDSFFDSLDEDEDNEKNNDEDNDWNDFFNSLDDEDEENNNNKDNDDNDKLDENEDNEEDNSNSFFDSLDDDEEDDNNSQDNDGEDDDKEDEEDEDNFFNSFDDEEEKEENEDWEWFFSVDDEDENENKEDDEEKNFWEKIEIWEWDDDEENDYFDDKEEERQPRKIVTWDAKRNCEWSSFNELTPNFNYKQEVNKNIEVKKNQMVIMRQDNVWKYNLFQRIFNWLSRERWEMFSKQKIQWDDYKNVRLEQFREIDLIVKKLPHAIYIDLTWMNLLDTSKEVNEKEIWEYLFEFWWSSLFEKKWFKWVKSQFFWKWRFYVIYNDFLNDQDYYKITTKFIDNWDYESILVWYDLLENKYVFSTIEELRHYSVVWASWSWKTVWLISLINQYLMKNNTDIIFIEKWTDLETYLRECERMIYKSDVEVMRYEHIISIFTYINMELARRKKIFAKLSSERWEPVNKIQLYNQIAKEEWKPFMKYLLLVIDEFSRLRDTLWNESKESEEFFLLQLKSLIQVARSYWIYCMLATQNPTSEWWVPSNIQLNLSTKILWLAEWASSVKYLTHTDERAVARQWKIRMWDFLFNAEWQSWMTITRMFKVDQLLDRFIQEWYIVPKTEEEKKKIWLSVDNYSNDNMNKLIHELLKENKDVELLNTDHFTEYWIDINWLDKIWWIKKLSVILIINILIYWFENEVCKKIRETNLNPANFDMNQSIDRILDNEVYQQLWFIFVLVKSIYFKYLDKVIKVEKISKSEINKAKNWEDSSTESIEMYLEKIKENIVYNVNDTINRLY